MTLSDDLSEDERKALGKVQQHLGRRIIPDDDRIWLAGKAYAYEQAIRDCGGHTYGANNADYARGFADGCAVCRAHIERRIKGAD